ncbi:hypothetical protein JOQ06_017726 [Pogonophryne albipinna]|uniref:Endosome-associated-trafficking regulator 1 n=1 Tax=Pogonophryne albipinna TaxID=1090488 RepID=A0AAD6AAT7_9TELE|nr:hypothetical protein JOQ06_017726 [Pogonophryne albipinna]
MVDLTSYLPLLLMGLHQCKEGALASLDCSVIHLNFTHVMDVVTKVTNLIRGGQRSLEGVTFDPEVRSCFFSEPSLDPQEEEWGLSLQFSSRPEAQQGAGAAESYEGDDETSMAEAVSTCRGRSLQQLQEENQCLRRSIRELQRSSQADQRRVEQLTEELLQRRRREEQEAQDLESMVHSVEQNLTQMTVVIGVVQLYAG